MRSLAVSGFYRDAADLLEVFEIFHMRCGTGKTGRDARPRPGVA